MIYKSPVGYRESCGNLSHICCTILSMKGTDVISQGLVPTGNLIDDGATYTGHEIECYY